MTNQSAAVSAADKQAVTGSALRRLMRSWPTGVAIVTTSFGQVAAGTRCGRRIRFRSAAR